MTENPPERTRRPRATQLRWAVALITSVVLLADQLSKVWAVAELTGRGRVDLVGDLFGLRLVRNPGAAFSLATGATWIFTVVAVVVVVVIIRLSRRLGSRAWALCLGLLLGGAVGNLIDRLVRQPGFGRGHVIDFFQLPNWPVFNVADSAIVTAAVLIGWLGLRGISIDGTRAGAAAPDPDPEPGVEPDPETDRPATGPPAEHR